MDEIEFSFHDHPLHRSGAFSIWCDGCSQPGYSSDGYRCSECYRDFFMHQKCAESPLVIDHSSHHQHPLNLSCVPASKPCHLCDGHVSDVGYGCSACDLWLHISCSRNPPSHVIENPKAHEHSLTLFLMPNEIELFICHICGYCCFHSAYVCSQCEFFFHVNCVNLSPEIKHPSHPSHPLQLLMDGAPRYSDGKCCLCGDEFEKGRLYHCSLCNYSLNLDCVKCPPPLTHKSPKTHEHKLTLIPRHLSFTCNACGKNGDRSPYVCLQCNFMIHRKCFDLPLLININRHDHRISRTYLLGLKFFDHDCAVCHRKVDWPYGGYICSSCPNFVAHPDCSTTPSVWDGKELIGTPEEIEDMEPPFKVIDDSLINHFTHEEHNLRLNNKDDIACDERIIECKACIRPVYSDPFYSCTQCNYILHETCANLPRTKRHPLFAEKLTLVGGSTYLQDSFTCHACDRRSTGFRYCVRKLDYAVDVQCISISEPLNHDSHPHPLYFVDRCRGNCEACGKLGYLGFRCIREECEYFLHYGCAVLPKMVEKHKADDHPLFQCYGEDIDATGRYWCDICEREVDPKRWFYTCDRCCTTFHIDCVLGDLFMGHAAGSMFTTKAFDIVAPNRQVQVVANNGICRPYCDVCKSRCKASLILKTRDDAGLFICSSPCLRHFIPPVGVGEKAQLIPSGLIEEWFT
ncbi:PREDICTED: uncharacterized protein LOC104805963 [Tarenaya hassleriana]|uniref:uncharacterized protein LOC104805963 n=1 Tax=Tarenaya hassleriana TaxID=28532 RepID=UPI00053C1309|nr:PREDICTED: uncharacterized protein LOC104805963 [Tarenaya hassleriana]